MVFGVGVGIFTGVGSGISSGELKDVVDCFSGVYKSLTGSYRVISH